MNLTPQSATEKLLRAIFYGALGLFITTVAWKTGWHMEGDAYALGPYLPWLEIIFPLAGLGLWGAFFSQWALGHLRPIHLSRWFYLMLFMALLMVSVLFSIQPEVSLSYFSIWMTGSLVLSLQLEGVCKYPRFWSVVGTSLGFNYVLAFLLPGLVNAHLLMMLTWALVWLYWKQHPGTTKSALFMGLMLIIPVFIPVHEGLLWLIWLSVVTLWITQYPAFRRKYRWLWFLISLALILWATTILEVSYFSQWRGEALPPAMLEAHNFLQGFGVGQFEWAQFEAQGGRVAPDIIVVEAPFWQRWWYEQGWLMFPLLFSFWMLCLNTNTSNRAKSLLFWGILFFYPELWLTTNGILLGAFWFFNRESWAPTNQSLGKASAELAKKRPNRWALK